MKLIHVLVASLIFTVLAWSSAALGQTSDTFSNFVNGLPVASTIGSADQLYIRQGGVPKQLLGSSLLSLAVSPVTGSAAVGDLAVIGPGTSQIQSAAALLVGNVGPIVVGPILSTSPFLGGPLGTNVFAIKNGSMNIWLPRPYGWGGSAAGFCLQVGVAFPSTLGSQQGNCPVSGGFGVPGASPNGSGPASYPSRDTVAGVWTIYSPPSLFGGPIAGTFNSTQFRPTIPLTGGQIAALRVGMPIDTSDLWSGLITGWDASGGTYVTVLAWFPQGGPYVAGTPSGTTGNIGASTKIFGGNIASTRNMSSEATQSTNVEFDVVNNTGVDDTGFNDFSAVYDGGLDVVSLGSNRASYGLLVRRSFVSQVTLEGNGTYGLLVEPTSGTNVTYGINVSEDSSGTVGVGFSYKGNGEAFRSWLAGSGDIEWSQRGTTEWYGRQHGGATNFIQKYWSSSNGNNDGTNPDATWTYSGGTGINNGTVTGLLGTFALSNGTNGISISGTTINENVGTAAYSFQIAGNTLFSIVNATGAVNSIQAVGASTTNAPAIAVTGTDTNVSMLFKTKGTGVYVYQDSGGTEQFRVTATASAANSIYTNAATAGGTPFFGVRGSDTNISMLFFPKGTGGVIVRPATDNATAFRVQNAAGSSSYLTVDTSTPAVTIGTTIISSPSATVFQHGSIDAAAPVAQTLGVQNVVAGNANTAAANFTIRGGLSNGTGGGDLILATTLSSAASGVQNTTATALTLKGGTQQTIIAGNLLSARNIVYAGAYSLTAQEWYSVNGSTLTGTASTPGGGDGIISPFHIYVGGDSVDTTTSGNGNLKVMSVVHASSTGATGGRVVISASENIVGTPGTITGAGYVAVEGLIRVSANMTGVTGVYTNYKGAAFGANFNVFTTSGATFLTMINAQENDVSLVAGTSAAEKHAWTTILGSLDAVRAVYDDNAIQISSQDNASAVGWKTGIMFGGYAHQWAFAADSTLIGAQIRQAGPASASIALNGVDFSSVTFQTGGCSFKSTGFCVDPAGNVTDRTENITVAGTTTLPALAFTNCGTNCGFLAPASGQVQLVVGGTNRFDYGVSSASNFTFANGAVIISGGFTLQLTNGAQFTMRAGNTIMTSPANAVWQLGAADAAASVAQIIGVQNVVAGNTNTSAANFTVRGGLSNGTGGGDLIFQTTLSVAASGVQNTAATALTLKGGTQQAVFSGTLSGTGWSIDATGNGTYSTTILSAAGTTTLPALAFTICGTNCGFIAPAANQLELVVGGVNKFDYGLSSANNFTFVGAIIGGIVQLGNLGQLQLRSGFTVISSPATAVWQLGAADAAAPVAQTLGAQNVLSGNANVAGANFIIRGSLSNGSGGGDLILQTTLSSAGSGVQNTAATALTLKGGTQQAIFAGTIINTGITTDATHTTATVCEDTTTHQLYFGSAASGTCVGTSSARYKHGIEDLDVGLSEIMGLRTVKYFLNEDHGDPTKIMYGFIAEEAESVLPRLVGYDSVGRPNTFDYLGVVPALVHAIQELKFEIETLKGKSK